MLDDISPASPHVRMELHEGEAYAYCSQPSHSMAHSRLSITVCGLKEGIDTEDIYRSRHYFAQFNSKYYFILLHQLAQSSILTFMNFEI